MKGIVVEKRLCESPSDTEKAKFLRSDKTDDDETNSKSIGFLKLMLISLLDPNKLNSNKEVLQRFSKYKVSTQHVVAVKLLLENLVNYGKIHCPTKSKTTCIKKFYLKCWYLTCFFPWWAVLE